MDEEESEFPVGYRKPPRHTQFKQGQSGNPNGRPKKKTRTFAETLESELHTLINTTEGGKSQKMTKLEAIVKQQINKAAKGDPRATGLVIKAIASLHFDTAADYLSPVLQAMRAIHAKHETANKKGTLTAATSPLPADLRNDRDDAPNDPA